MPKACREVKLVIENGSDTSDILQLLPTESVVSINMPSTVDGTYFNVKSRTGTGNMNDVWNSGDAGTAATQFKIFYAGDRFIRLNPADFYGMSFIQLISDATQNQEVTLTLVIGVLC